MISAIRAWLSAPAAYRALVLAVLAYCLVQMLFHLAFTVFPDGSGWQQGDWLINVEQVPVRRGFFGSALIALSDHTGLGLLGLTVTVQYALLAVLLALLAAVFLPARERLFHALLLASPAFVPLFWAADPNGGLRKEMVAYIALLLLLLWVRRGGRRLLGGATALFVVSFAGHEACVLFTPLFLGILLAVGWHQRRDPACLAASLLVAACAIAALAYALRHARVDDLALVCQPLLARHLAATICDGAISYLTNDAATNAALVKAKILGGGTLKLLPLYLALVTPGLAYAVSLTDRPGRVALCCLAAAVPFLVLYPAANDWGRWLGMQVFCVVVVLVAALSSGLVSLRHPPRPAAAALVLLIGLLASLDHAMTTMPGLGVPGQALHDARMLKPVVLRALHGGG